MKKELYNKLIETILGDPSLYSSHKVTIKDGLISHCFGHPANKGLEQAKQLFKTKGYKEEDVYSEAQELSRKGLLVDTYFTILYGEEKDKISSSVFNVGYEYAFHKKRYFPLKRGTPLFCWSKHMYTFVGGRRQKPAPRILTSSISCGGMPRMMALFNKIILGIDYVPKIALSYRYMMNSKDDFEAIGKRFGVKVPEAMKQFEPQDLFFLYKTMQDHNQINKVCQFLKSNVHLDLVSGVKVNINDEEVVLFHDRYVEKHSTTLNLHKVLSQMLFGDYHKHWLIRDYIADNLALKKRDVSLKVTSLKRWEDEHNKAAKLRMLKGVPKIETKEYYNNALTGLEYPYELINTKERLVQESVELHHCVATYANKINKGDCAIFSIEYAGERWTLEVAAAQHSGKVSYTLMQFRGACNKSAPEALQKRVNDVLLNNSCPEIAKWMGEESEQEPLFELR